MKETRLLQDFTVRFLLLHSSKRFKDEYSVKSSFFHKTVRLHASFSCLVLYPVVSRGSARLSSFVYCCFVLFRSSSSVPSVPRHFSRSRMNLVALLSSLLSTTSTTAVCVIAILVDLLYALRN